MRLSESSANRLPRRVGGRADNDRFWTDLTNVRAVTNLAVFESLIGQKEKAEVSSWDLPKVDDVRREARNIPFRPPKSVKA